MKEDKSKFPSKFIIDENNKFEKAYWSRKWGVSEKQLDEALEQTQHKEIEEVRNYLENHKYIR